MGNTRSTDMGMGSIGSNSSIYLEGAGWESGPLFSGNLK